MYIKRLRVSNFKSFRDMEVELGRFCVFVGANASGKSNFVSAFRFLKDIAEYGIEDAIALQGGKEYFRNLRLKDDIDSLFGVEFHLENTNVIDELYEEKKILLRMNSLDFLLEITKDNSGWKKIPIKKITADIEVKDPKSKILAEGKVSLKYGDTEFSIDPCLKKIIDPNGFDYILSYLLQEDPYYANRVLEQEYYSHNISEKGLFFQKDSIEKFVSFARNFGIYDIDPKLSKKSSQLIGRTKLQEDAGNISIVLDHIIEQEYENLYYLVSFLLSFIEEIGVSRLPDKSFMLKFKERGLEKETPAFLLSDGTINIVALIIALFFDKNSVIIIEEPEKNIHPSLISRLIELMKERSQEKQIIITTHSPEVVKYAGIENLYLTSKSENGFTEISKPKDSKFVNQFLKSELGIEDLFVDNMLEVSI